MERKAIDQILSKNNIELDEEVRRELINDILSIHHQELSAEKERADQANATLNELQRNYDSAIKNSENLESLKGEIANLKSQNKKTIADIESAYQAKLLNSAIELALTQAGAKNNKAAAALIDTTNLKLNEDGTVLGLSELIDSVKKDETTSFLFNQPEPVQREEKKVYNYIPQTDVAETSEDSIAKLFEATSHDSNSQIQGW